MTMQTKRKFTARKWLAAMLCLTIALVATHLTVWAVDLTATNTLTVKTAVNVDNAEIKVDVYKLASTVSVEGFDTYGYEFLPAYQNITVGETKISDEALAAGLKNGTVSISNDQWNSIAQQAAQMVKDGIKPDGTYDFATPFSLNSGVYLIIARGSDLEDYWDTSDDSEPQLVSWAQSDFNKFTFTPAIISLPTKNALPDGTIGTAADYGPWIYESEIDMKAEIEPLYGSIQITKQIDRFEGNEEVTFIFEITADGDFDHDAEHVKEYHYYNVATVPFDQSTGTSATVTVDHIRAGAEVQVKEIYTGLRYRADSLDWQGPKTVIADSEDTEPISFSFINYFDNEHSGGHGIQNHFTRVETENGANWGTPEQQIAGNRYR